MKWILCLSFLAAALTGALPEAEAAPPLDFNRDIRPILANHCWNCHGPDEASREAELRLDLRESALAATPSGRRAIVAGDASASELVARIEVTDDAQMPPASFQKPLSPRQRELLKQWIAEGAPYSAHWAFVAPQRPALPEVADSRWPRSEIDRFVLHRLEAEKLSPAPEADRGTWLRRVTLDLTGLPPTPDERSRFLADSSPHAYEAVVDRLLESPRHAERMAMQWLDSARYADTNGYNNDEVRTLWPWRDWVIDAFARNLPYDRFLTEQLAGDLLPEATLSQKVATGFSRNHVLTTEGGIVEEEYRVEYVADRVHTTATVFLGLTMQCARCHDHKYDPLTQRDYYRFAAFFDNVPDKVVPYSQGRMAEPLLKVPTPAQQAEIARLETRREELGRQLRDRAAAVDPDLTAWEAALTPAEIEQASPVGLLAHFPLDETEGTAIANGVAAGGGGVLQGTLKSTEGKLGRAVEFDGTQFIAADEVGRLESDKPCSFAAWVYPTSGEASTVLSRIDEGNAYRGYDLILEGGKVASHFVHHWPDRAFKVITKQPLSFNAWHHVVVTYDGSRRAAGMRVYVDGQPQEIEATTDNTLDGPLETDKPFHIGRRNGSAPFRGRIDDVQLYSTVLAPEEAGRLATGRTLAGLKGILATAAAERTPVQRERLKAYYLDQVDAASRGWRTELAEIPKQIAEVDKAIPVTMVMAEMSPRRKTHLLKRGQYDQPGEEVQPGVVDLFPEVPADVASRLDLARWLTHPKHPLTARVAVNRWWEMLLGTGLVETVEDFGIQGALPTHPELLDWLATELIRQNWNTRALLRQIVLSATYRQSSRTTPELLERDPRNRLLARGPRYRLPAETVRDNALAISGLLVERVGGPSVKPYQPEGLWEDVSVERRDKYAPDLGDGLYRRSMYTFWKRTCPPPGMSAFDAPDRETCVVRRSRTNTPLQALVLLNDPTYVEAARKLAERTLLGSADDNARLVRLFELAVCRTPDAPETELLLRVEKEARAKFTADPDAAKKLLAVGHSPLPEKLDPAELAAWTTVASLVLNLDETISKP
ncbi:DUF1553 domain-containing protein [Planctomyces sp. SH-PL14]|uniref:DUF1553 domain-containing protein n=1 Tax=Planctomyces sp. SH-PL14 TaxID=1632864 RepID=UPI00078CEA97|nr:DUF1553 domain-containing protein [Planctomyces sp. SH-PL14]AMV18318.1 Planctomycete cytochrome C [Planctomyces sp. SH-PL14]